MTITTDAQDELEAEHQDDDDDEPAEVGDELTCPECGEDYAGQAMAKARLGLHRKREHGIQGQGGHHRRRGGGPRARPPRPRAERPPASARGGRAASRRDLEDGTREAYESLGLMMMLRGDEAAARLIIGEKRFAEMMEGEPTKEGIAGQAAKAWAKLAQHNDTVEKNLGKMLSGGDWAELVGAHMPLLILAVRRNPQKAASVAGGLAGALRKRFAPGRRPGPRPGPHPAAGPPPGPPNGYGFGPRVVPS